MMVRDNVLGFKKIEYEISLLLAKGRLLNSLIQNLEKSIKEERMSLQSLLWKCVLKIRKLRNGVIKNKMFP